MPFCLPSIAAEDREGREAFDKLESSITCYGDNEPAQVSSAVGWAILAGKKLNKREIADMRESVCEIGLKGRKADNWAKLLICVREVTSTL